DASWVGRSPARCRTRRVPMACCAWVPPSPTASRRTGGTGWARSCGGRRGRFARRADWSGVSMILIASRERPPRIRPQAPASAWRRPCCGRPWRAVAAWARIGGPTIRRNRAPAFHGPPERRRFSRCLSSGRLGGLAREPGMQQRFPRSLGLWLLALSMLTAWHALAQPPSDSVSDAAVMTVGSFSTIDGGADHTKILDGEFDGQFLPVAGPIELRGGSEYTHWLRLTPNPTAVAGNNGWRLRLERLPLDRLSLYLVRPGQRPESRYLSFYYPSAQDGEQDGVLANGFVFELPDPLPATMYLAINTRVGFSVTPTLLVDRQYHVDER